MNSWTNQNIEIRKTDVSALISTTDADRSLQWIEEAKQSGATIAIGEEREGDILQPTVLLNVDPKAKVSCQEVFAPIVLINKVSSVDEAIGYVNDSKYGLQAGIYTPNVATAFQTAETLEVGGVMINDSDLSSRPYALWWSKRKWSWP
ncbi:acyl-CoA reductase-like NAD-dependent aldehyde dehydrogenase [Peribacillus cavernae]|nr:acyl-CoA reductase-like NAD-dependent aldehyde dehydrogenase [Peribacillus cavernae]